MAYFNPEDYWNRNPSGMDQMTTHYERVRFVSAFDWAQKAVATNSGSLNMTMDPKTFFALKQDLAIGNDEEIARFTGDADEQEEKRAMAGILTPEEQALLDSVNNEASKKILQMYHDAYMAPFKSDIQYRLGNVQGVWLKPENAGKGNPDYGLIDSRGRMYTRTNFSTSFPVKFWDGGSASISSIGKTNSAGKLMDASTGFFFTNLLFPPYKWGRYNEVTAKATPPGWQNRYYSYDKKNKDGTTETVFTSDQSFDPRNFLIKKDGFNYREPAYKAINDNIMFLQYLMERSCGIVSTYLTEWDLSLYMQEGIVTTYESLPSKVWLLYRIDQDNPLAAQDSRADDFKNYNFTDTKAYAFGVVNAAVSKIFKSNLRPWRPSDYPLSAFWAPYLSGLHLILKHEVIYDVEDKPEYIPYYDFYDQAANDAYDYEKKIVGGIEVVRTTKEKVQQVDFIQAVQAGWADFDLQYYMAFYSTPEDAMSDTDREFKLCRDERVPMKSMVQKMKDGMIAGGGANGVGGSSGAGSYSGYIGRIIKKIIKKDSSGKSPSEEISSAERIAGGPQSISDMIGPKTPADGKKLKGNKVQDTSKMAKDTGIAYSPCLYGGPHGAFFSPHTTQSYFDKNTLFLRDIPRTNPMADWSSLNLNTYKQGNDRWYYNGLYGDKSPNETVHYAQQGYQSYATAWAQAWVATTRQFDGQITYAGRAGRCVSITLPSHCEGYPIRYQYYEVPYYYYDGWSYNRNNVYKVRVPATWYTTEYMYTTTIYYLWNRRGMWYSYYNDFTYSRYMGGGRWQVGYRCPHCIGTYEHWIWRSYKKLLLHDEPNMDWYIRPYQWHSWSANVPSWRSALGRAMARFGGFRWTWGYIEPYVYSVGFRLQCPGNNYQGDQQQYRVDIRDDIYGWTNYTLSGNESAVLHKMVRLPGCTNNGSEIIFCQGPSGETPHSLFSARVFTVSFPMWYWQRHERSYSCRRKRVWYTLELKWAVSLMVDMWNGPRFFASDLHKQSYNNMRVGRYNTATGSFEPNHLFSFPGKVGGSGTIATSRRQLNDPLELLADPNYLSRSPELINEIRNNYQGTTWFIQSFSYGFHWFWSSGSINGRGMLSSLQGFDPNTDAMKSQFEDPSAFAKIQGWTTQTPFNSFNYQCHQVQSNPAAAIVQVDGTRFYAPSASVQWKTIAMPQRIKNAILKWATTSTFYKSDISDEQNIDWRTMAAVIWWDKGTMERAKMGHPYTVDIDTGIRVFFSQLLYQRSFLEYSKELFLESVDFKNVRILLNNCIDKVVLNTTDPKITGYSYWIQKAVSIFGSPVDSDLTEMKDKLLAQVNSNIAAYDSAVEIIEPRVKKQIGQWTFDDWYQVNNQLSAINAQNEASTLLSDYYMAYLNVLYEYRKYFICVRFNKEDGTMWVMRALESLLPWVAEPVLPSGPPPPIAQLGAPGTANGKQYNVAFFELQNNLDVKKEAVIKGLELPEDAIKVVYIKVKWGTQKNYEDWLSYAKSPVGMEPVPEVVKVFKPIIKKETVVGENGKQITRDVRTGTEERYAFKPQDNEYTLISTEWEKDQKNVKWNNVHKAEIDSGKRSARVAGKSDTVSWWITWKDDPTFTPIVYDIFSNVDVMKLIDYSQKSMSAQELLCFSKNDADFWQVAVTGSRETFDNKPRKKGHKTKLRLKVLGTAGTQGRVDPTSDINYTIAGALGYSVWPITEEQNNPTLGDVSNMLKSLQEAYGNQLLGS